MSKKKWIGVCVGFVCVAIGMNVYAYATKPATTKFTEEFVVEEKWTENTSFMLMSGTLHCARLNSDRTGSVARTIKPAEWRQLPVEGDTVSITYKSTDSQGRLLTEVVSVGGKS